MDRKDLEIWFVTGSQDLYGEETLRQVAENSRCVVEGLNASGRLPLRVVATPVVTTPASILAVCRDAGAAPQCAGVIAWMHTFSPAKMWIAGLRPWPSRWPTCTRSSTAICPGRPSTWIS